MSTSFREGLYEENWYQTIRGWSALFLLIIVALVHIPCLLVLERRYQGHERGVLWMRVAQNLIRFYLRLAGVKIELVGSVKDIPCPTVYAGNHLTMMDGLILNVFFGPRVILLSAPFSMFSFPFSYWFKKGGMIEISRDEYDATHFKGGEDRKAALEQLLTKLAEGRCVLIFPEGHYEKTEQLHYIHTGVARIAIRSKCPIQLFSITYKKRIFLDQYRVRPGKMTITLGPVLSPPSVSKTLPFRKATIQLRQQILDGFETMLPPKYLPNYLLHSRPEHIAAFFDLDRTLYKHFSQKDFFRFLIRQHQVSRRELFRFLVLSLQKSCQRLTDRQLAERCYAFFSGRRVEDVKKLTEAFFKEVVPKNLVKDILPFVKDHQETEHQLILVTAVPHPLSQLFAKQFQMMCLDTELEVKDGCYTGRVRSFMDGDLKTRAVKICALQHHLDLDQSYAFADSWTDYGMLHCVRYPVVVNPDKRLLEKALEKKWKVLK